MDREPHYREVFMFETLERLILLQVGAAAATRERVEEIVNRLIEQGRLERAEGRTVVADVLRRASERSEGTRSLIDASVQQGLRGAGVPNRESYEDVLFRVEQLEHRVRLLEDQPAPSTTAPPEGEPTSPMSPADGIDVPPQPPRDEPDTPPGL
jgi:polyhydroxyalkanoate synthesis regulator phasin